MYRPIPQEKIFDSFLSMRQEGYAFICKKARLHDSDIFQIRLMGQSIICMTGKDAAALFYDTQKFVRKDAIPKRVQKSLFGKRAVHTLDDAHHTHRKKLFMSMMTAENIEKFVNLSDITWHHYIEKWERKNEVTLFTEAQKIMCRVACAWAGVPLQEHEVLKRTQDFTAMVDAFGAIGVRFWKGKSARKRMEKWIGNIIAKVRRGEFAAAPNTPLYEASFYKDHEGNLLELKVAAVELINFVRPIVAISYYISFAAHALTEHPEYELRFKTEEGFTERFVNEVRRFYPFAPFLGARVRNSFEWNGYLFPEKALVLLDVYGTNHDPRIWKKPDEFWPDNFADITLTPFDFIPQGGGDPFNGHRCPGEWITIEAMKVAINYLTSQVDYDLPPQDLSFSLTRMPTYPKSGMVLKNIRRAAHSNRTTTKVVYR